MLFSHQLQENCESYRNNPRMIPPEPRLRLLHDAGVEGTDLNPRGGLHVRLPESIPELRYNQVEGDRIMLYMQLVDRWRRDSESLDPDLWL